MRTSDAIEKYFQEIDRRCALDIPSREERLDRPRKFAPPVVLAGGCLLYQLTSTRKVA
jgi:hypothetical protein